MTTKQNLQRRRISYLIFVFGVQIAGGVVKNQDFRASDQSSSDGDPLLLASGHLTPLLPGIYQTEDACRASETTEQLLYWRDQNVEVLLAPVSITQIEPVS